MELLINTNLENDVLSKHIKGFNSDWELIVSGESSQSPFHQWRCGFFYQRCNDTCAIKMVDYGDPDYEDEVDPDDEYPEEEPYEIIVAVLVDAETKDNKLIVKRLMEKYVKERGKYIEIVHEFGELYSEPEEIEEIEPEDE